MRVQNALGMAALLAATTLGLVRDHELVLEGADARCLAGDTGALFAGTQGDGVLRSEDGGTTWVRAGLAGYVVKSLAVAPGAVYAGVKPARVLVSSDLGSTWHGLAPFPRARSWFWATPAERPFRQPYVSVLAVAGEALVAGIEAGAVLRSADGGRTWSGHRSGAFRDPHLLVGAGGRLYLAGSGGCVVSGDGGLTWKRFRDGLDRRYGWSVAVDGETAYLAVAPYRSAHSGHARARIFRSEAGAPWEPITDELPYLPALAASPSLVYAGVGEQVWRSADRGASWTVEPLGLGSIRRLLALP